jgi:hypothetical protein
MFGWYLSGKEGLQKKNQKIFIERHFGQQYKRLGSEQNISRCS